MPHIDRTALVVADRDFESTASLDAHESNALVALHAFGRNSTTEARALAMRAIEAYVDVMREAGFPPEQMTIAIKAVARRADILRPTDTGHLPTPREHDLATEKFVAAAIRSFYRPRLHRPAG